jgi:hypothetical protein
MFGVITANEPVRPFLVLSRKKDTVFPGWLKPSSKGLDLACLRPDNRSTARLEEYTPGLDYRQGIQLPMAAARFHSSFRRRGFHFRPERGRPALTSPEGSAVLAAVTRRYHVYTAIAIADVRISDRVEQTIRWRSNQAVLDDLRRRGLASRVHDDVGNASSAIQNVDITARIDRNRKGSVARRKASGWAEPHPVDKSLPCHQ